jgi:hypothetical protein
VAAVVCVGALADALGVPASWLVAGVVVGLVAALRCRPAPSLPAAALLGAQAVIGGALGAQAQPSVVADVSRDLPAVVGVAVATLALSLLTGLILARAAGLDRPTAVLGMLAGAAEGVVAASQDARADARLVTVMQYLRVLIIVASVPVLVSAFFESGAAFSDGEPASESGVAVVAFAAVTVVGALVAHRLRVPLGVLVGPLMLGAVAAAVGADLAAPAPLTAAALAVIGLAVGLSFDAEALRQSARLLPAALGGILLVLVGSGAFAVVLARVTGVDGLTAYLATSPGAFNAVLATAYDTGANAPFVLAVQMLRFLVMVAAAPALAHLWSEPSPPPDAVRP